MRPQNSLDNIEVLQFKVSPFNINRIHDQNFVKIRDNEERVKLLLLRDLFRLNWRIQKFKDGLVISPPIHYDKETVKRAMSIVRSEIINKKRKWIEDHISIARSNLAQGKDILNSNISPRIEVCETEKQHNIFRIFRYYWSSPYSEYVGRRIRLLIRDDGLKNNPVIGIAALGSSIIHIPDRDKWIGWDKETRTRNIVYTMDAYVLGALPPYNYLLGGKLISYILASNEVRKIYKEKYEGKTTILKKRKIDDLVCLFTTSLYGSSSQYNRLRFKKKYLYIPIGVTSGYGTLHISNETFSAMCYLLSENKIAIKNRFGDGPNWRMRVIRSVADIIGFDSDVLLQHSFKRGLYAIPLTKNFRAFLLGSTDEPIYYNRPIRTLVEFWNSRWFKMRKKNPVIVEKVLNFIPNDFEIY